MEIEPRIDAIHKNSRDEVARLQDMIRAVEKKAREDILKFREQAGVKRAEYWQSERKLRDESMAIVVPKEESLEDIQELISSADDVNNAIGRREQYKHLTARAQQKETVAAGLTKSMDAIEEEKRQLIAKANLPVEGLELSGGVVMVRGTPFHQMSDGEKWRTAVAIAMAGEPSLRVVLIRRASLIDAKNLAIATKIAKERGWQLWLEFVQVPIEQGAIVMEEGAVRNGSRLLEYDGPDDPDIFGY